MTPQGAGYTTYPGDTSGGCFRIEFFITGAVYTLGGWYTTGTVASTVGYDM